MRDHNELNRLRESGTADLGVAYDRIHDALSDCLIADPEETGFAIHCESLELQDGDLLILYSDGVHDVLGGSTCIEAGFPEVWQTLGVKCRA